VRSLLGEGYLVENGDGKLGELMAHWLVDFVEDSLKVFADDSCFDAYSERNGDYLVDEWSERNELDEQMLNAESKMVEFAAVAVVVNFGCNVGGVVAKMTLEVETDKGLLL